MWATLELPNCLGTTEVMGEEKKFVGVGIEIPPVLNKAVSDYCRAEDEMRRVVFTAATLGFLALGREQKKELLNRATQALRDTADARQLVNDAKQAARDALTRWEQDTSVPQEPTIGMKGEPRPKPVGRRRQGHQQRGS